MRCDVCGSSDSIFFIKPDGVDGELRMCRACAVAKGYAASGEGLGVRLDSLVTDIGDEQAAAACPSCGWTAERLRSSGRLGCPECARTFRREILSILKRSGRSGPYEGKLPSYGIPGDDTESPASLSAALEEAIGAEDFERAAAIRDTMRKRPRGRAS